MSESHSSYVLDLKNPTEQGFTACLVVTPITTDGKTDVAAKIERNMGHKKCVQFAYELLAKSGASPDLLADVHALAPTLKKPITL